MKKAKPMKLYCDNKATINIMHKPVQQDRTKHVEINWYFLFFFFFDR